MADSLPTHALLPALPQTHAEIRAQREQLLYAAMENVLWRIDTLTLQLETVMSQNEQLATSVAASAAAAADLAAQLPVLNTAIMEQVNATQALRDIIAAGPTPSAELAAAIAVSDQTTADLVAAKASLAGAVTTLGADDAVTPTAAGNFAWDVTGPQPTP